MRLSGSHLVGRVVAALTLSVALQSPLIVGSPVQAVGVPGLEEQVRLTRRHVGRQQLDRRMLESSSSVSEIQSERERGRRMETPLRDSYHDLELGGGSSPELESAGRSSSCPVLSAGDLEKKEKVLSVVSELAARPSGWEVTRAGIKGVDKVQLTAALTSILGEATIGTIMLHDAAAVTDGLLAIPTVLVSLLGGAREAHKLYAVTGSGWKANSPDTVGLVGNMAIWVVCIMLLFQGVLQTVFHGIEQPKHYPAATAVHAGFLSINILQGVIEWAGNGHLSAGTDSFMDTLRLSGRKFRRGSSEFMVTSGLANLARQLMGRVAQVAEPEPEAEVSLDHFTPITKDLARVALEAGLLESCSADTEAFYQRSARLRGTWTSARCRQEWHQAFRKDYDASGPSAVDDDELDPGIDVVSDTTLKKLVEVEEDPGMMRAILLDGMGNLIPVFIFGIVSIIHKLSGKDYGMQIGATIFAFTTLLQAIFAADTTKAIWKYFTKEMAQNPVADRLVQAIQHEMYKDNGKLAKFAGRVQIKVSVLSKNQDDMYKAHQARFHIFGCPVHQRAELEAKLKDIRLPLQIYSPEVWIDTANKWYAREFTYVEADDPRPGWVEQEDYVPVSSHPHAEQLGKRQPDSTVSTVQTFEEFAQLFPDPIFQVLRELQVLKPDQCENRASAILRHSRTRLPLEN